MTLYLVNYEEYMHYKEYIEAQSPEEAKRMFENSISQAEPIESGVFTYDITDTADERTTSCGTQTTETSGGNGKHKHHARMK